MADEIDKRTTRSLIQKKSNETDILVLLKGVSAKLDQNQKELKNLDIKFDKSISDITCKLEQESICIRDDFHDHFKIYDNKLANISQEVQVQSVRIDRVETDIENNNRIKRLNDIVLRGVPAVQTRSGFVFVQLSADCKLVKVNCLEELSNLKNGIGDTADLNAHDV
ncbi:hypothetical protein Bhyg_17465, partial [Pseudolycoriella hygida]